MTRTLTDAERIVSIREAIEAARGDWHEATTLLSVCADLHWLLARAESPSPEPYVGPDVHVLGINESPGSSEIRVGP